MCRGSEAGSYLRLIDCVYHSTLGLRVKKKKKHRWQEASLSLAPFRGTSLIRGWAFSYERGTPVGGGRKLLEWRVICVRNCAKVDAIALGLEFHEGRRDCTTVVPVGPETVSVAEALGLC